MIEFKLLFSEYFDIKETDLEAYGALNMCLSADLPLFIDPFLLFASEKQEYKELHKQVVSHLVMLRKIAVDNQKDDINLSLFKFPEIKQNWLGLSKYGNAGKGLGNKFANNAIEAFNGFYKSFGEEYITKESHIEKLTLMSSGIGKDFISDFTTNLIFDYLLTYTEAFAKKYLANEQCKTFSIRSVFNTDLNMRMPKNYRLPYFYRENNGDFILLSPIDLLTKDEAVINHNDFASNFKNIASSIGNRNLRNSINDYFRKQLPRNPKKPDEKEAIRKTILKFPEILDYYIKGKEDKKEVVSKISRKKIEELVNDLIKTLTPLCKILEKESDFYKIRPTSYEEALKRVMFLKDVIENKDVYRIFYKDGKAISNEDTIQGIFKLTWYATPFDVNAEVNNGRGPADFKVSYGGSDSTIVEFKLGKSSSIKRNLINQTEIYKKASMSINDIKVILCYTDKEINKVKKIIRKLKLETAENIVIIDGTKKLSASLVK